MNKHLLFGLFLFIATVFGRFGFGSESVPPISVSEETALPYLISEPQPISYPLQARRQGSEGQIVIVLEILENGSVGKWRIIKSTGDDLLDKTAVNTILTWKFHPAIQNGKPIPTYIQVPIEFSLIP